MGPLSADQADDPPRAGRYVLGRVLGAGGMGVVRASHDPALDREIAVKLIVDVGGDVEEEEGDETKSRLVRLASSRRPATSAAVNDAQLLAEARALARVAHPNIVEVFDVGVCEGGVFLAMELVDGPSLRAWNEARHPDWRTAVALHLDAGEALAAAHRVGIVHGDFKPDNVLVGRGDRVKVVDFGLARAIARFEPPSSDGDSEQTIARPDAVFGTPAYLAPECWGVAEREPSCDQFAFFVALFEAIVGHRPFRRNGSLPRLLVQMTEGVDPRALNGLAPARLVRAIVRGIDPDPARRFTSMGQALAELRAVLADDETRRTKRRIAAVGLVVVLPLFVATVGTSAWSSWRRDAALEACETDAGAIEAEWDDAARASVRTALVAADPRTGASTSTRVESWLDDYAADWTELRATSCARAADESTIPSAIDRARDQCFSERRASLAALVELFAAADEGIVRDAVRSAAELPRIAACDDEAWLALQSALPEDPVIRARIDDILRSLARADQLTAVGRAEAALELTDAAVVSADELGWAAVRSRARFSRGMALVQVGRYPEANDELESAYFHAGEAADDTLRADIAAELASLVGTKLAHFADGLAWARHAETALAAIGGPESATHARLAVATSAILVRSGAVEQGIEPAERALAISTRIFGPDHPSVGSAELTLGTAFARLDRTAEAVEHFDRAREIFEETLGPEHMNVARVLHNLGMAELKLEHYDEARKLHERSLAIRTAVLPADHPDLATSLDGLAYADLGMHRFDEAKRGFARTLAMREAKFGPEHPAVADALANVAQVAEKRGECREGVVALDRALAIVQKTSPDDRRKRLQFGLNLGDALLQCHELSRALAQYEAAKAIADEDPAALARQLERANQGIAAARVTAD